MQRLMILSAVVCAAIVVLLAYPFASPEIEHLLGTLDPNNKADAASAPSSKHEHDQSGSEPADQPHQHSEDAHSESGHSEEEGEEHTREGEIKMQPDRIQQSRISIGTAGPGTLNQYLSVPAVVVPDRNRLGRVPAKVVGTVSQLKKQLGDRVAKGEVVAVLESREVADAKSEYIAALVNFDLQGTLYEREQTLWKKKVTAEQRLLKARATQQEAQVRRDLARQKLLALGVHEKEIEGLRAEANGARSLERYDIRAPIGGRIVEQMVDIGQPVGGEGQAKELYAIADLSKVWAELTVSTSDLTQIKEGQPVTITMSGSTKAGTGSITFISPMLDQDTRSARVIASIANSNNTWQPGSFVTAKVSLGKSPAAIVIPKSSLQNLEGKPNVFVRTASGFEAREVTLGNDDGRSVEIVSGLNPGEQLATANTFLLKADIGKSEAGHAH